MTKKDLKKELKAFYSPSAKEPTVVEVPTFNFLMVDGSGDPNSSRSFAEAVEALYSVSYAVKFRLKQGPRQIDYGVMPLEGLWWSEDMSDFVTGNRDGWLWTLMLMQPSFIDAAEIDEAMTTIREKKKLPGGERLRFGAFTEGRCAQILHIGPFAEEGPTVERLHAFIDGQSGRRGRHHEIYLSDTRKAAPEKWKTILRQPML